MLLAYLDRRLLNVMMFALALVVTTTAFAENEHALEYREPPIGEAQRSHWSFSPLERPALPVVSATSWPRTPVDHFILARLEREGLSPLPLADRVSLIRRVTQNLTGLPPTPEEVDAFVADDAPSAYERLVDRLLASPAYGERWAQHWLDLARFAETDGFEHDHVRPDAWQYRDWVIAALNDDMPYDRFVQLQLAGDEVEPGDKHAKVATMFCLSGPDMPDINSMDERKHNLLNEITGTVGEVLLGLQMGCAQCHDHKYDPISQADFYRLRAVFEPAVHLEKNKSVTVLGELGGKLPDSHLMIRGDWQRPGPVVQAAFPRIANPADHEFNPADVNGKSSGRRAALARWITRGDNPLTARVIVNRLWQHHFGHGLCRSPSDFGVMGQRPTHPELLDWLASELVRNDWSLKSIHRLIVASETYRMGSRADMPGWPDMIRQSAKARLAAAAEADPDNKLLARFPRRRLDAEPIRDSLLAAAGALNLHRGGPGVRPPLPEETRKTLLRDQWNESPSEADHFRRSIYIFARRNLPYPFLHTTGRPDANASCPARVETTTPLAALLMLNSEFPLAASRRLAGRAYEYAPHDARQRIDFCFRRTLSRGPTDEELRVVTDFLASDVKSLAEADRELALPIPMPEGVAAHEAAALTDLCLALFNTNEFIFLD